MVQWLEYVVANDVIGVRFPVGANKLRRKIDIKGACGVIGYHFGL